MTNKNYHGIAALSLALALTLSPAISYAKEKNGDKKDRDDKQERVEKHSHKSSCFHAYGHLIAPGFIKTKGIVELSEHCRLPFGIWKKFFINGTSTASTTPDTTAPRISKVSVSVGTTTASVSWRTNEKASSKFYYGTTSPLSITATSTTTFSDAVFRKDHSVALPGLTSSTTYYFILSGSDSSGNATTSAQASFMTR